LLVGKKLRSLRPGLFKKIRVSVQDELGRLHEELRGRFAYVQRDQLKLG
jgi:hypothetical protein